MTARKRCLVIATTLLINFLGAAASAQTRAEDASAVGGVVLPAVDFIVPQPTPWDPLVLPNCKAGDPSDPDYQCVTEIKGRAYFPAKIKNNDSAKYPIVLFLHGNHQSCGRPFDAEVDRGDLNTNPKPHIDDCIAYTYTGTCCKDGEKGCAVKKPIACSTDSKNTYTEVRSDAGYEYLAKRLAGDGYVVISVDANRGIALVDQAPGVNDPGLILARGRLVLRHLQTLSKWNSVKGESLKNKLGVDLYGKLDFKQVGLFGHSRGGEGMRAAYNLYSTDPAGTDWKKLIGPVTFRGIFELGPTDIRGRAAVAEPLNASDVPWNVLLPACDGDVFDLEGIKPFDRLMGIAVPDYPPPSKSRISSYFVWGANHNFYNSEWQTTDGINPEKKTPPDPIRSCYSPSNLFCVDPNVNKAERHNEPMFGPGIASDKRGTRQQQDTALSSVTAFFRSTVAPNGTQKYDANFNPLVGVPDQVVNPNEAARLYPPRCIERAYSRPPATENVFESFSKDFPLNSHSTDTTDVNNSTGGTTPPTVVQQNGVNGLNDSQQRVANIKWSNDDPKNPPFLQDNWTVKGKGMDISSYKTLNFRIARQKDLKSNPATDTDFTIWLIGSDPKNYAGPVQLRDALMQGFASLTGPTGEELPDPPAPILGLVPHELLNTVRIRLDAFKGIEKVRGSLRGVQFVFDTTKTGAIYMSNITLSPDLGPGIPANASLPFLQATRDLSRATEQYYSASQVQRTGTIASAKGGVPVYSFDGVPYANGVRLELRSDDPLPMGNAWLTMWIGSMQVVTGNILGPHHAVFTLTPQQFAQTSGGESVILTTCESPECGEVWNFGSFDKAGIQTQH
jgi:hypothetical protein